MTGIDSTSLYGTLNLLVLKALTGQPLHGLAIANRIERESDELLRVEEGALYPALHRLERDGLVEARWGRSDNNRRAKFYQLTTLGRQRLERETSRWIRHTEVVSRLLGVRPIGGG